MFKAMKLRDIERDMEKAGFVLVRNSTHKVYQKGNVVVMVPHSNTVSPGTVHGIYKAIKKAA